MKNFKLYMSVVVLAAGLTACSDDEDNASSLTKGAFFQKTFSSFAEGEGSGDVQIAVEDFNGSEADIEFEYGGTATKGVDYDVTGFSEGVLTLEILEDDSLESDEYIKVLIKDAKGGVGRVKTHTVYISSNCEDALGMNAAPFAGDWHATEFYCGLGNTSGNCDYGPYDATFAFDPEHPNQITFDDFYDSGYDVYMEFDFEAGTVRFPNQNAGGDATSPAITASSGTFTIDLCEGSGTIVINLNYDGSDWVYQFTR